MIRATIVKDDNQPYLTELKDQNEKTLVVNSSRKQSEYLSPSQLLQAGLAGCMSMTIRGELFRNQLTYRDVTVTVDMEETEDNYAFRVKIEIDSDEDRAVLEKIKQKVIENCYVKNILFSNDKALIVEE